MQRVSSLLPTWERTRSVDGKNNGALGKVFGWADKITTTNRLSTASSTNNSNSNSDPSRQSQLVGLATSKIGREAYWPTNLDKECEKAARILKSFCTDGFISHEPTTTASEPTSPTTLTRPGTAPTSEQAQLVRKIPPRIVQNAVGLAIFSCMRSGLWMSGSGGSGILIARKADGTWSPPSGILLHTAALGFVIGVDIYDCVLVINSVADLEIFTRSRLALGSDVSLTVGPVVAMGLLENDNTRWGKDLGSTVLTYLKARGQHRAVRLDGSMVTERGNENERFYGSSVEVLDILAGNVRKSIPEIDPLFEAIKAAEGRSDYDIRVMQALSQQPAPGDAIIETPTMTPTSPKSSSFGVPDADDPDPFGVIALEMAGLEIREAGTRLRPTSTQFEFAPSPTSPLFNKFSTLNRQSVDTYLSHSNRGSYMSNRTQATTMTDAYTQTTTDSPRTSPSPSHGGDLKDRSLAEALPIVKEPEEIDYTKIDMTSLDVLSRRESLEILPGAVQATGVDAAKVTPVTKFNLEVPTSADRVPTELSAEDEQVDDDTAGYADDEDDDDSDDDEEPVIIEVATASQPTRAAIMSTQVTQVIHAKGALVTIPKRLPPALPARNPARSSRASKSDYGGDVLSLRSPLRQSFDSNLKKDDAPVEAEAEAEVGSALMEDEATQTIQTNQTSQTSLALGTSHDTVKGHHRHSSSVYTTIPQQEMAHCPETPRATEAPATAASSTADDDSIREPQTPRPSEEISPAANGKTGASLDTNDLMKVVPNHINATTIQVA